MLYSATHDYNMFDVVDEMPINSKVYNVILYSETHAQTTNRLFHAWVR